jgi:ABC-2 type transport system permease protein
VTRTVGAEWAKPRILRAGWTEPRILRAGWTEPRTLRAEWTKLRTLPSTWWLLAGAIVGTVAIGLAADVTARLSRCAATTAAETSCAQDTTKLSLSGVQLGQLAIVALAALAMTNEYTTQMIHTTLTATPRRLVVLAAKASVVAGGGLGAGLLGVLGSLVAADLTLPRSGSAGGSSAGGSRFLLDSLTHAAALRAVTGTVLYLGLIALLSLGVAAIIRDTAASITTMILVLYAAPMVALFITDPTWHQRLQRYAPMTAGLAVQATKALDSQPIGPWRGLGVLAVYACAMIVLGGLAFCLRDS